MTWLRRVFEAVSYLALLAVVSGLAAIVNAGSGGRCPQFHSGGVKCVTPFAQSMAEFGLGVALVSAFTGVPLLLGLAAIFFLVRRWVRWRRD